MNLCARQRLASIDIAAPVRLVYAIATDIEQVARYEPGIEQLNIVEQAIDGDRIVNVRFRILGLRVTHRYRHVLRPSRKYAGVRTRGLLRGWFTMRFKTVGQSTRIIHAEGFRSALPGLASLAALVYFSFLSRGEIRAKLRCLRDLVLSQQAAQDNSNR